MVDAIQANPGAAFGPQPIGKITKSADLPPAPKPAAPEAKPDAGNGDGNNDVKATAGAATVKQSLAFGEAVTGAAIGGATQVVDLLNQAKATAQRASQPDLSAGERKAAQADFDRATREIDTAVQGAEFEGFNLLDAGDGEITIPTPEAFADSRVKGINLSAAGLGVDTLSIGSAAGAGNAVAATNGALSSAGSALARFGATATRIGAIPESW